MIRLPPYRPATSRPIWDYQLPVRGVVLRVRLEYRYRAEGWYLSVWADGEAVVQGKRIIEGWPILWRYRRHDLPDGRLCLFSLAGDASELLSQDGLGWTHCLYWVDPEDQTAPSAIIVGVDIP